ncbi:helix-turn-helix domain-containing protein [Paraburkholderia agricolaris]
MTRLMTYRFRAPRRRRFPTVLASTPGSYLRAMRLNGVRRDLVSTQGGAPRTVQSVAADWGFWHLSQFATDYRKLFGKRPSESLREALVIQ